jgi:uncharacterized Zn finger protein
MKRIKFKCENCGKTENIPLEAVRFCEEMDGGDPLVPPRFECKYCGGIIRPIYYKGIYGYIYRWED